jgi:hypothetical protein
MAKKSGKVASELPVEAIDRRVWANSHGTYIAGQAAIDGADSVAIEMERKWGIDRLRLLVSTELREKFDRQRYLFNQAIHYGELIEVQTQAARMAKAWQALDAAAQAAGKQPLDPMVWEVVLGEGEDAIVASIVPDAHHAHKVVADGRAVMVYTLAEIGHLLHAFPAIAKAKQTWPGATVTATRKTVNDPLDGIADSERGLDDPLDDLEF